MPEQPQGSWSHSLTRYKAAIHPRIPSFLRTSAERRARAFHILTSKSSITYLAHKNWTKLPTYMEQTSSEYTKRAGINKIQLVPTLSIFINNAQNSQNSRGFCYTGDSEPTICGYNAAQRWEMPPTNISVQPRLTRAVQANTSVCRKGTVSSRNGTDGASFPGKYRETGNRMTSHPGKELILVFRSKRLQ